MNDAKPNEQENKPAEKTQPKPGPTSNDKVEAKGNENKGTKTETVELFNANDGIHGRNGGPYLDEVEALRHEKLNALREGREVDTENIGGYPGIVLRTKAQLVDNYNPTLIAGDDRRNISDDIQAPVYSKAEVEVPEYEADPRLDDNPTENGFSFEDLEKIV